MEPKVTYPAWWGEFDVPVRNTRYWRIGPFELWLQHLANEWRITTRARDEPMDSTFAMREAADDVPAAEGDVARFGVSSPSNAAHIEVLLADRSVVTWPEIPFTVPAAQEVTVHVSTPLWVRVCIGAERHLLAEFPLYRPSDTWFGATTLEGELCYSSRTRFVLHLANMPVVPHRAITSVRIQNRAPAALSLERIKLPVPHLSLFQADAGALRTDDVTLERTQEDEFANLKVANRKSRRSTGNRVSEPRDKPTGNLVVRAFSSLLQHDQLGSL